MAWDPKAFAAELLEVVGHHHEAGTDATEDVRALYASTAKLIADAEVDDLSLSLHEPKGQTAAFRAHLHARWGHALDLFELLLDHCWDIGGGTSEHYGPIAGEKQDHRFEALIRLHGKASLTASEVLALLQTGHANGAMARWRTLHEVDVTSAFLYQNSDEISRRYLRYEAVQTLKARRAYDRFHERLGYEPTDPEVDGDPDQLRASIVEEFGEAFLDRNGWAAPVFGHPPKDSEIEEAAQLDHYRPYYYLASDSVHATPRGLMATMQQIGNTPMVIAGPSNAGLADPGHGAALSLARCTMTLIMYCGLHLRGDPLVDEQASVILATHLLLEFADRIGEALMAAHERLVEDEAGTESNQSGTG